MNRPSHGLPPVPRKTAELNHNRTHVQWGFHRLPVMLCSSLLSAIVLGAGAWAADSTTDWKRRRELGTEPAATAPGVSQSASPGARAVRTFPIVRRTSAASDDQLPPYPPSSANTSEVTKPVEHSSAAPVDGQAGNGSRATEAERRLAEKELRYQRLHEQLQSMIESLTVQPVPESATAQPSENSSMAPTSSNPQSPSLPQASAPDPVSPVLEDHHPGTFPAADHPMSELAAEIGSVGNSVPGSGANSVLPEESTPAGHLRRSTERMLPSAIAVTDGPIDRLALANNLFAINEFVLALEMYEQIDRLPLSGGDEFWVEYQIASCHRKLGQLARAQKHYGLLVAQPDAGWLCNLSRWWLDRVNERMKLESDLAKFDEVLSKQKAGD